MHRSSLVTPRSPSAGNRPAADAPCVLPQAAGRSAWAAAMFVCAAAFSGGCRMCPDPFDYSGPVPNGSSPQNDFRARSNGIRPLLAAPRPWPPVVQAEPEVAPDDAGDGPAVTSVLVAAAAADEGRIVPVVREALEQPAATESGPAERGAAPALERVPDSSDEPLPTESVPTDSVPVAPPDADERPEAGRVKAAAVPSMPVDVPAAASPPAPPVTPAAGMPVTRLAAPFAETPGWRSRR